MSYKKDDDVKPKLGFSPKDWARLLTLKLTQANPRNPEEAEVIYAELFRAALRSERAACAEIASRASKELIERIHSRDAGGYFVIGDGADEILQKLMDQNFYEDLLKPPLNGSIWTYPKTDDANHQGIYQSCRRLEEAGLLESRWQENKEVLMFFVKGKS